MYIAIVIIPICIIDPITHFPRVFEAVLSPSRSLFPSLYSLALFVLPQTHFRGFDFWRQPMRVDRLIHNANTPHFHSGSTPSY